MNVKTKNEARIKRLLALLLACSMAFALVGCDDSQTAADSEDEDEIVVDAVDEGEAEDETADEVEAAEDVDGADGLIEDEGAGEAEEVEDEVEEAAYVITEQDAAVMYAVRVTDVRSEPAVGGTVLGTLAKGEAVTVIGVCEATGWYQISLDDDTVGYVYSSALSEDDPLAEVEEEISYTYTDMDETTMYVTSAVNVRDLPSKNGEQIGSLSTGASVTVTGKCNESGWYRIDYNGKVGYVSSSYLSSTKPTTTTTTSTTSSTSDSNSSGSSSSSGSSGSGSSSTTELSHEGTTEYDIANHDFVEVSVETITNEEVGHWEQVLVKNAVTDGVYMCKVCGYTTEVGVKGSAATQEIGGHIWDEHDNIGRYTTTQVVVEEAVYEDVWVVDEAAYDTWVSYYECSCGLTLCVETDKYGGRMSVY